MHPDWRQVLAAFVLLAGPCHGLTLQFPAGAAVTADVAEPLGSYALPVGPWSADTMATRATEGSLRQSAWKLAGNTQTTLELLKPLRDQVVGAGYRVLFECAAVECGGFDFRFATRVLPEPDMHVDLGDFRFLSAERGNEAVSLLVSRSSENGFVQIIQIVPGSVPPSVQTNPVGLPADVGAPSQPQPTPAAVPGAGLVAALEQTGAQALDDLAFASGSSDLAPGSYTSLTELAAYLIANPARTVALVGHTDASGALEANITLSRRRAASVVDRLLSLGVPRAQMTAQGVGYLAPRTSNLTEEGRTTNRRVEVVLTSTQ